MDRPAGGAAGVAGCAILSGVTRPGPATRGRRAGARGAAAGPGSRAGRPPDPGTPGPGVDDLAPHRRAPASHRHAPADRRAPADRHAPTDRQGSADRGVSGRDRRRARGGEAAGDRFAPPYRLVELRSPDGPLRARLDPSGPEPGARRPFTSAARSHRSPQGSGGPLRRFVRAYGWRAYAVPLLTVLTVLCGVDVANGAAAGLPLSLGGTDATAPASPPAAAPPAATTGPPTTAPRPTPTRIYVDDAGGGSARPLPPTALPPGGPYTKTGGGRFDVVPGSSKVVGSGPLRRYAVELEAGVVADGPAFAAEVERILGNPRGWTSGGRLSLQRVDGGPVDFRVSLTASLTVRRLCGYTLPFETSCYNGELGRAVINDARWVRGAVAYAANVAAYRIYVINHEVGHALGRDHQPCPKKGALAPVMMQQTLGLETAGVGSCRPNALPYP